MFQLFVDFVIVIAASGGRNIFAFKELICIYENLCVHFILFVHLWKFVHLWNNFPYRNIFAFYGTFLHKFMEHFCIRIFWVGIREYHCPTHNSTEY